MLSISSCNAVHCKSLALSQVLMSCLHLRLPPAKKAWKSFTSKLQSRLHKLHKSKAIKKPKNRLYYVTNTTSKAPIIINPSPFLGQDQRNVQRKKNILQPSNKALRFRQHRRCLFKMKAGPVYIDKLFSEPTAAAQLVANKSRVDLDQRARAPGTSNVGVKEEKASATSAADDMWESLALASPQMNGIDQRAEEFIQSFRAEMELQEIMASRL